MRSNLLQIIVIALASILILSSCKGNTADSDDNINDTIQDDFFMDEEEFEEESSHTDAGTTSNTSDNADVKEAQKEIVKKYGEQWDFCTCIQKSDSVNTALMNADDDDFDMVMARSEFIDSKCKTMLIQPNSTPEDRLKHEKRVKRCLSSK